MANGDMRGVRSRPVLDGNRRQPGVYMRALPAGSFFDKPGGQPRGCMPALPYRHYLVGDGEFMPGLSSRHLLPLRLQRAYCVHRREARVQWDASPCHSRIPPRRTSDRRWPTTLHGSDTMPPRDGMSRPSGHRRRLGNSGRHQPDPLCRVRGGSQSNQYVRLC